MEKVTLELSRVVILVDESLVMNARLLFAHGAASRMVAVGHVVDLPALNLVIQFLPVKVSCTDVVLALVTVRTHDPVA